MNPNYEEKLNPPRQLPNENTIPQLVNSDRNVQTDQQQNPISALQGQASSTSSVSTLVAGNDVVSTPPSTNLADSTDPTKVFSGASAIASSLGDTITENQEVTSIAGSATVPSSKVSIIFYLSKIHT